MGAGIAVLVMGLAALVWWSLPDGKTPPTVEIEVEAGEFPEMPEVEAGAKINKLDRPPRAVGELAILTTKSDDEVKAAATNDEIAKHLEARHCGAACDAVKKQLTTDGAFTVDLRSSEDMVLPPKDTLDVVAIGLTPAERDNLDTRKQALLVDVDGPIGPEQLSARLLYAAVAELAEQLDGVVYDEAERRIFSKEEMLARTIQVPVGQSVFKPEQIAIQLYRSDDGAARMTTLGMQRFGAPDLAFGGANMTEAPLLVGLLNDAARVVVNGASDLPLKVKDISFDGLIPEKEQTDPENDLVELQPTVGGPTRETWDHIVTSTYGTAGDEAKPDEAVTKKIRASLPDAVKRFQAGDGYFFMRGPFPIPEDERLDGGAGTKQLWIQAASCGATLCSGVFQAAPNATPNVAPGKTVSVNRNEASDWMIRQRDGGTAGGETLRTRAGK